MLGQLIRFFVVLLGVLFITCVYWFLYGKPAIGIDDANIYFVYVRNFAEGHGFVYNVGGERVEGFTSMLWVLLTTPLYYLGDKFESVVLFLNVLIISVSFFISLKFVNRLAHQNTFISVSVLLFVALLTLIGGYIDWTILTLMETGLWSLLLISITVLLCREELTQKDVGILSGLLVLLVLTRPESLMMGAVFIGLLVIRMSIHAKSIVIRKAFLPTIVFVITIIGLIGFRLWYFKFPFPNTYYAKVSDSWFHNFTEGIRYFIFCIIQSPLLIPICISAGYSLILIAVKIWGQIKRKEQIDLDEAEQIQFILCVISFISLLIPVNLGGDHFKLLRFYQPYFPIYLFMFFNFSFWRKYLILALHAKPNVYRSYLHALLIIPFFYFLTDTPLHIYRKGGSPIQGEFDLAELGREDGRKMSDFFASMEELPSVGVSAAGGFAYGYKGETVDLLGLNNVEMAHSGAKKIGVKNHAAFDKDVFYRQAPEIFHGYRKFSMFVNSMNDTTLYENSEGFDEAFASRLYKKIFRDEKFKSLYKPVIIADTNTNLFLKTYCNVSYIQALQDKGYAIRFLNTKGSEFNNLSVVEE